MTENVPLDINSRGELWMLSNFAPWRFVLDGVRCGSMEGFLQSLKAHTTLEQTRIAALVGYQAKRAGREQSWPHRPDPWWKGRIYPRLGPAYAVLLTRAYAALADQNPGFVIALRATGEHPLTHRIGKSDPMQTILTEAEFVGQLMDLRKEIRP